MGTCRTSEREYSVALACVDSKSENPNSQEITDNKTVDSTRFSKNIFY